MLEKIDLTTKLTKEQYKERMSNLSERLYYVQQGTWAAGIPVAILFEGWDAAGKGTTIHKLTDPIDPRGYKIYPIRSARTYEKKRPWLWRFWLKAPARGEWAIFDRSWYGRVLVERMEKLVTPKEFRQAYRDIVDFERNLYDDGALIIKFFLHISQEEQKMRFKKLSRDPLNAWRVNEEDWRNHKRYKKWVRLYEELLEQTDTEWGPWTIVEATDRRHTHAKVYETIIRALEARLGTAPQAEDQLQRTVEENDLQQNRLHWTRSRLYRLPCPRGVEEARHACYARYCVSFRPGNLQKRAGSQPGGAVSARVSGLRPAASGDHPV